MIELVKRFIIFIAIITPLTLFLGIYLTVYKETPVPPTAWVSWYDDPRTSVYIGWETPTAVNCTVFYGTDPNNLLYNISETTAVRYHIINITGLNPGTQYYYRIETAGGSYTTGRFRTAPDGFVPFSFVMFADTQQKFGPGWHDRLANVISHKNYSFAVIVGDFTEDGSAGEWHDFFKHASAYSSEMPLVPVKGNHDDNPDPIDGALFDRYFVNTLGSSGRFYYSFNYSNVHFQIAYFPELDLDDGEEGFIRDYNLCFTPEHINWLRHDLENAISSDIDGNSSTSDFLFSFFHCPITGAGFYGPNRVLKEELLPILQYYGVDITVSGHAHHYERGYLEPVKSGYKGTVYFIVGTGGGLSDVALRPVSETRFCSVSPSYTEVHVGYNSVEFITYSLTGEILDRYILVK